MLPVAFLEALDISGKPSAFIRMRMSPATGNLAVPLCTETAPGMSEPTALGNPVGIEHWVETGGPDGRCKGGHPRYPLLPRAHSSRCFPAFETTVKNFDVVKTVQA